MKIYYSVDEITDNYCNPCPVLNKDKNIIGRYIGSIKCRSFWQKFKDLWKN